MADFDDDMPDFFDPAPSVEPSGTGLLYGQSESVFAATAPAMVERGWSVFPQEVQGRMPGKVRGQTLKWGEDHDLKSRQPTPAEMALWCMHCPTLNVANVFGAGSGNTWALDVDVTDPVLSAKIVALADRILGRSPFRREGRAPKTALIYRHGPGDAEVIPSVSRYFSEVDGDGNVTRSGQGVEILGNGKLITFWGKHHKTGNYFRWLDANPMLLGPEAAPLVTPDQAVTFMEAVDAIQRFHRGSAFTADAATYRWDEATNARIPTVRTAAGGTPWFENGDGKLADGRETYLRHLAAVIVNANWADVREGGQAALEFKRRMTVAVAEQFEATAVMDRKWTQAYVRKESKDKVSRYVDKILSGRMPDPVLRKPKASRRRDILLAGPVKGTGRGRGSSAMGLEEEAGANPASSAFPDASMTTFIMPPSASCDPELSFLTTNKPGRMDRKPLKGRIEPPLPGLRPLDIPADRSGIAAMVRKGLLGALESFFTDVYGTPGNGGDDRRVRLHILKAPPGAGKTSQCIRYIGEDERTYADYCLKDGDGSEREARAPIVVLLPTYANIAELRQRAGALNLDSGLDDEGLRKAAYELGLIAVDDLDARVQELRRDALNCTEISRRVDADGRGLVTMVYSGKIKAGCHFADKVAIAMEAGVGTAPFCKASVPVKKDKKDKPKPGEKPQKLETVEELCKYYDGCPAIAQRTKIAKAHVVFMPHSFLSLSIPEELSEARAIIADERIHHLFLHSATFSVTTLMIPRRAPRLTKNDTRKNITPQDLLMERDDAAQVAVEALRAGRCPAEALYAHGGAGQGNGQEQGGNTLVTSAIRVCSSAIQKDARLTPSMPIEEVRALCSQPTGLEVREEHRFWTIIQERIQQLNVDDLRAGILAKAEAELAEFQDDDRSARPALEAKVERLRSIPRRATGQRDARIQYLTDNAPNGGTSEVVRISWRTTPNWAGVPVLLLDASAAPPIAAKIWNLRESDIVVHDIVDDFGTSLNVKVVGVVNQTFSNSSLVAGPNASETDRVLAAGNLEKIRQTLATVSSLYGDGRVVAGTSKLLREVINSGWAGPDNIDWCHYGAMRGLDGFKHHAAAVSVGRMEVPTRSIDGLVAALTYDDPIPETPLDIMGNGMDPDDDDMPLRLPIGEQRIRLRSGHVAVIPVPMFPGRWGRMIQKQYREEELNQFVGRLRPVYREGRTPVWFALSSVIPEELIVDELVHIDDLLHGPVHVWEAVRRCDGVASPEIFASACPSVFKRRETPEDLDPEVAAAEMRIMGFGKDVRNVRGFRKMHWRTEKDGVWLGAFVRADIPEPAARLVGQVLFHLEEVAEILEMDTPPGSMARPVAPDGVELMIGDRKTRRAAEGDRSNLALTIVAEIENPQIDPEEERQNGAARSGGGMERKDDPATGAGGLTCRLLFPFPAEETRNMGMADVERFALEKKKFSADGLKHMSMAHIDALLSIRDHWNKKRAAMEITEMLVPVPSEIVEDGEYQNYERMGDTVSDEDFFSNVA